MTNPKHEPPRTDDVPELPATPPPLSHGTHSVPRAAPEPDLIRPTAPEPDLDDVTPAPETKLPSKPSE